MDLATSPVDRLETECVEIVDVLQEAGEISLCGAVDDTFRKVLVVAAASYFEGRLTDSIRSFASEETAENHVLRWLIEKKAISRQYHTWFNWDGSNANQFFSLFGSAFKTHMKSKLAESEELRDGMASFLELGRDRNRVVHQNFGTFSLEKTAAEICASYRRAAVFVEWVPQELREFSSRQIE